MAGGRPVGYLLGATVKQIHLVARAELEQRTFSPETSHFFSRKPMISSYRILVCRQTLSFVLSS